MTESTPNIVNIIAALLGALLLINIGVQLGRLADRRGTDQQIKEYLLRIRKSIFIITSAILMAWVIASFFHQYIWQNGWLRNILLILMIIFAYRFFEIMRKWYHDLFGRRDRADSYRSD
ncbi:MAG: hypothetical protein V1668_01535 [Patescibacteria group bacterium]